MSQKMFERLIDSLKKDLKQQEPYIKKCKEYGEDIDFIDNVEIYFKPLDVSAKTVNGVIILNENLILSGDWESIQRYIQHESCHVMQQLHNKVHGRVDKDKYLDDENEQEAFQAQLEYMSDHESPEEIQQYLEQLLDHHNIKNEDKREKYIEKLTKDI